MDVSSQMLVFVRVVDNGSISATSRSTGQTPSAVSKQIGQLEDHVGHRLLHRTKTGVTLTEEGRAFYEKCRAVARSVQEAEDHILSLDGRVRGVLRVASSVAFGKAQLIPAMPAFLAEHPDLTFSLELTDRQIDLEGEDFDAAISFNEQLSDPTVVTRKIMTNERILCASPAFLDRHGAPRSFTDLANFNCLRSSNATERNHWIADLDGRTVTVDARGNFVGNSADAVYRATLAGLGIARLSTYLVNRDIAERRLVHLLPDYVQKRADIAVTFAARRNLAPKTRTFVDFLVRTFRDARA